VTLSQLGIPLSLRRWNNPPLPSYRNVAAFRMCLHLNGEHKEAKLTAIAPLPALPIADPLLVNIRKPFALDHQIMPRLVDADKEFARNLTRA
jgi:hypothetical protein